MTNDSAHAPGERVLQIGSGESVEDFIHRVADTAPAPSPAVMDRIRTLLCTDANDR